MAFFIYMSGFFSSLAKKLTPILVEQTDAKPADEVKDIWETISQAMLAKDNNTIYDVRNSLVELKHQLVNSFGKESEGEILAFMEEQQVFSNLVTFSIDDIPNGLSDEIITFFYEFTKPPLLDYLTTPNVCNALNKLLENTQPHNKKVWNELLQQLFNYLISKQESIELYVKDNKSALLLHYGKYSVQMIKTSPIRLLQLFSYCNSIPLMNSFYSTDETMIKMIIKVIVECCKSYTTDDVETSKLQLIDNCINIMTPEIANVFNKFFEESVLKPFLEDVEQEVALKNSIYLLINFSSTTVVKPVFNFLSTRLPKMIIDDQTSYLAFRCSTLLLTHVKPVLPAKYSGRLSSDFTNLLNANWFVNTDTTEILDVVRANVAKEELETHEIEWQIEEFLTNVKTVLTDLLDKDDKTFCALIEFITELASSSDVCVSFYTLSSECQDGFYPAIKELCLTVARRVGNRPATVEQLKAAYERIKANNFEDDSEGLLFRKIVLIIEFIKELNAIINVKNSFRVSSRNDN